MARILAFTGFILHKKQTNHNKTNHKTKLNYVLYLSCYKDICNPG